ncbi:MAG TPA: hypothetical protein VFT65_10575 [Candidatus Angelobacter sp.]|nr:hypothetical protein [Candidatus Angelobacter sp.]
MNLRAKQAILAAIIFLVCSPSALTQAKTSPRIHKLLSRVDPLAGNDLGQAFSIGDSHIDDLIVALRDPDPRIRENAQRVIRYLGNPQGMLALFQAYVTEDVSSFMGPVPAPLSEWDYLHLEKFVLCEKCKPAGPDLDYEYALALDPSPRAQEALARIKSKLSFSLLFGLPPAPGALTDKNLSSGLLDEAFFMDSDDRRAASVRLVAHTVDKKKALYQIHVYHGPLAEKWFNVVLVRYASGWRFLSVSFAGVS